jgi:predicted deacetylase
VLFHQNKMAVHVSLHDVSPAWSPEIERALAMAAAVGARPALLVVPNFHGRWPLLDHPGFCTRLRMLQAQGHEIFLHGFYHRARERHRATATRSPGLRGRYESATWHFAQRVASGGEAEFSDVTEEEAAERLAEGERMLEEAGLKAAGFVAPAWSMPRWLMPMLAARGYQFTEDHTRIYDPKRGSSRVSVVLNYASRTPGRLLSSVAWCRLAKHARAVVPARVAIHPADMRFALLRAETQRLLEWARPDVVHEAARLLA